MRTPSECCRRREEPAQGPSSEETSVVRADEPGRARRKGRQTGMEWESWRIPRGMESILAFILVHQGVFGERSPGEGQHLFCVSEAPL